MEISSAISKLQAATVTTRTPNTQQVQQTPETQPAKDSKVEPNETCTTQKKNQEINDKGIISKEALELLKKDYGVNNISKKDSANKTDLTSIVKENKNNSVKSLVYKNALKSYTTAK